MIELHGECQAQIDGGPGRARRQAVRSVLNDLWLSSKSAQLHGHETDSPVLAFLG